MEKSCKEMFFLAFVEVGGYFDGRTLLTQTLETRAVPPPGGNTEGGVPELGRSERIHLSFATYNSDGHAHLLIYVQCQQ